MSVAQNTLYGTLKELTKKFKHKSTTQKSFPNKSCVEIFGWLAAFFWFFCFLFESRIAQADLEPPILLHPPPKC